MREVNWSIIQFISGNIQTKEILFPKHFPKCQAMIKENSVMLCAIWYHLYNLKNVKNTHGGEKYFSMGVFHVFKIVQMVPNRATHDSLD